MNKIYIENSWGAKLFLIAGCFMLVNTVLLWTRYLMDFKLSILWPAIPAMTALFICVMGLFKLDTQIKKRTPKIAKMASFSALIAGCSLIVAAIWILVGSLMGLNVSNPTPSGLLILIVLFMVSMIISFLASSVASLLTKQTRLLGCFLLLPVASWGLMFIVGLVSGFDVGLSLDYYLNPIITMSFIMIYHQLSKITHRV